MSQETFVNSIKVFELKNCFTTVKPQYKVLQYNGNCGIYNDNMDIHGKTK
jgi:hypothetical protein